MDMSDAKDELLDEDFCMEGPIFVKGSKVRAQRKFAQGAYIPPNNNNVFERRIDAHRSQVQREHPPRCDSYATRSDAFNQVFQTKMSPTSFLDVVSFQGMHEHMQPIVLVERLPHSVPKPSPTREFTPPTEPLPSTSTSTQTSPVQSQRQMRQLNGSSGPPPRIPPTRPMKQLKRRVAPAPTSQAPTTRRSGRSLPKIPVPPRPKRRRETSVFEFGTDDEKPLTHYARRLARNKRLINRNETQKRVVTRKKNVTPVEFKVPKKPVRKAKPPKPTSSTSTSEQKSSAPSVETSPGNPTCGAIVYTTIQQVLKASAEELKSHCKKCLRCSSVNKIRMLLDFAKESSPNNVASSVISISTIPETGRSYIYIDMFPAETDQILRVENVPNIPKDVMHARILKKSQCPNRSKFVLLEHEHLLHTIFTNMSFDLEDLNKVRAARIMFDEEPKSSTSGQTRSAAAANDPLKLLEAPTFRPTQAEFQDPIAYFEKIMPSASKFGLCKVVPPDGFKPGCVMGDNIRFRVTNQYIPRLYSRWGPATREMSAIKAHLASQNVHFTRAPLVEGVEINLPKLFHLVQRNGGLKKVIEKKRWTRVAEEMRLTAVPNPEKKLDQVYVKYLLPYDTLSDSERTSKLLAVERGWNRKSQKMFERAANPLHRQKRMLGESESSEDEPETDERVTSALAEAEDCVVAGRSMNLATFKKVAGNVKAIYFPQSDPTTDEIEKEYWRIVLQGTDHTCVNTASIDTGEDGYGFTKNKNDPYGKHPWNLKMFSQNPNNILRSLGPVLGVTVPTLHLGMLFSTSCWHRDPHALPWLEYMHQGPQKIWYGIPNEQSHRFRKAVENLCPTYCQNKSIWLPSDIAMIPPNLLTENLVSLSRVVQNPGEFIIVFPQAYSCSVSTGYTVSESVYFGTNYWMNFLNQVFQEVRDSCEPTMFSLEELLLCVANDPRVSLRVLQQVQRLLEPLIREEIAARRALKELGITMYVRREKKRTTRKFPEWSECEFCRATLYLSKVTGVGAKNTAMCMRHALVLLKKNRSLRQGVEAQLSHTRAELEEILGVVQTRIQP